MFFRLKCFSRKLKYFPASAWGSLTDCSLSSKPDSSIDVRRLILPRLPLVMLQVLRSIFIRLPRVWVRLASLGGGGVGLVGHSRYASIMWLPCGFRVSPVSTSESLLRSSGWQEYRLSYVLSSETLSDKEKVSSEKPKVTEVLWRCYVRK